MKILSLMFLAITLTSCASTSLTPDAKKLIIVNDVKYLQGCTPVAKVFSSSSGGPLLGDPIMNSIGNSNSLTKIKNMAAQYGQVLYLYKDHESTFSGSEREGIVFNCPPHIVFKTVSQ